MHGLNWGAKIRSDPITNGIDGISASVSENRVSGIRAAKQTCDALWRTQTNNSKHQPNRAYELIRNERQLEHRQRQTETEVGQTH